jgi:hypothetical protein
VFYQGRRAKFAALDNELDIAGRYCPVRKCRVDADFPSPDNRASRDEQLAEHQPVDGNALSLPQPLHWFIHTVVGARKPGTEPSVAAATLQGGDQARRLLLRQFAIGTASPDRPGHSV